MSETDANRDSRHDDPGEQQTSSIGLVSQLVVLLLISPLVYVLSIGPVARLSQEGLLPRDAVRAFYAPVIWLHRHTPLEKPLEWYGALWGWQ